MDHNKQLKLILLFCSILIAANRTVLASVLMCMHSGKQFARASLDRERQGLLLFVKLFEHTVEGIFAQNMRPESLAPLMSHTAFHP